MKIETWLQRLLFLLYMMLLLMFSGKAQFGTMHTPPGWQEHYLFHTDNPNGSGVVSWGFHLNIDTIYCERYYGNMKFGDRITIPISTRYMMEDDSVEKYVWITPKDSCYQITYDRKQQEIVNLKIYTLSEKGFKKFEISGVVHFW